MLTILFEGWTHTPHSYCVVNINQLAIMARMKDSIKLYAVDRPPFNPNWPRFESMEKVFLTAEEQSLLDGIEVYDGKAHVDVIWRSWFPYDATPSDSGIPIAVQFTAEFQAITDIYVKQPDTVAAFIRRCDEGKMVGITPSAWNAPALGGRKNCRVVPHGCDPEKFHPCISGGEAVRQGLNIPKEAFVFLHIGAMTENKNIIGILEAFYFIALKFPHVWLLLKGLDMLYVSKQNMKACLHTLAERETIDAKVWDTEISKRVVYMDGAMEYKKLNNLYNAANCYLTPYCAEGFNLPALEAQACGLPVIATRGGPTDDFLYRGGSSIFVRSKPVAGATGYGTQLAVKKKDLVKAMTSMITYYHRYRLEALTAGIGYVRNYFTWDHAVAKLISALQELVDSNNRTKIC